MGEGDIIRFNNDKAWDDSPSTHSSEPETARDTQSLERICRSRGKQHQEFPDTPERKS